MRIRTNDESWTIGVNRSHCGCQIISDSMRDLALCTYENRSQNLIGLKLLCLSVERHNLGLELYIFSDQFSQHLRQWIEERTKQVTLIELQSDRALTWDAKPLVMLEMFKMGHRRVLWIDTDIIVTQDISKVIADIPEGALGVSEEQGSFDPRRVTCHGMEVGRAIESSLNTCLVYCSQQQLPLLKRWADLMDGENFRRNQALPGETRPAYIWSDQDVLSGIVCGKPPEGFSEMPLHFFGVNQVITHTAAAYRLKARLRRCFRPFVPFVHTNGHKPWYSLDERHRRLDMLGVELSLYSRAAEAFADDLEDEERRWILPRSFSARLCHVLALGNPHLRGAFPMILSDLRRSFGRK